MSLIQSYRLRRPPLQRNPPNDTLPSNPVTQVCWEAVTQTWPSGSKVPVVECVVCVCRRTICRWMSEADVWDLRRPNEYRQSSTLHGVWSDKDEKTKQWSVSPQRGLASCRWGSVICYPLLSVRTIFYQTVKSSRVKSDSFSPLIDILWPACGVWPLERQSIIVAALIST